MVQNGTTLKVYIQVHFNNAINYFNQALELDGKSFDAQYSIGSMYFNKAVEIPRLVLDAAVYDLPSFECSYNFKFNLVVRSVVILFYCLNLWKK